MSVDITFEAPLAPRGQGRPRTAVIAGHACVYEHADDRRWKQALAAAALPYRPVHVLDGPLAVDVLAVMPRPQRLLRRADPAGLVWCTARPDADNIRKAVLDGLATWWRDDALVVAGQTLKAYAEREGHARLVIRVRSVLDAPDAWVAAMMPGTSAEETQEAQEIEAERERERAGVLP